MINPISESTRVDDNSTVKNQVENVVTVLVSEQHSCEADTPLPPPPPPLPPSTPPRCVSRKNFHIKAADERLSETETINPPPPTPPPPSPSTIVKPQTYWDADLMGIINRKWEGRVITNNYDSVTPSRGVAILIRKDILNSVTVSSTSLDNEGRIVRIDLEIDNRNLSILSIYAPNHSRDRIAFLQTLGTFIDSGRECIVCGDYNDVFNHYLDRGKGKVTVIQSLLVTQLYHILTVLCIPNGIADRIQTLFTNFIWDNKQAQIKYSSVINSKSNGGLGLPDIKLKSNAFGLKVLKNVCSIDFFSIWKSVLNYYTLKYAKSQATDLLKVTTSRHMIKEFPPFYQLLFNAWNLLTNDCRPPPNNLYDVSLQPLFDNPLIKHENKPIKCKLFSSYGIKTIFDIIYYVIPGFLLLGVIVDDFNESECTLDYIAKMLDIIQSAIPHDWLQIINTEEYTSKCAPEPICIINGEELKFDKFTSKTVYNILIK
ncbi:hypothetical protein LOTGIDRAFT_176330, partial [Lottia gigantea]